MPFVPLLAAAFALVSPDIRAGATIGAAQVWNRDGCTGRNAAPALRWSHAPRGTRSFAVTLFDPDAPTGRGWWHWVAYDIPARAASVPHGAAQGVNDFGSPGYGGPCPPPGPVHHYVFTVYALDVARLPAPAHAGDAQLAAAMAGHVLGKATLSATYGR